jgi:hypothetical protein
MFYPDRANRSKKRFLQVVSLLLPFLIILVWRIPFLAFLLGVIEVFCILKLLVLDSIRY